MSINKKIFWIFLSIVFVIFALGITIVTYQNGNKNMHKVLYELIDFNKSVYELRELQINILSENSSLNIYDIQKNVENLKQKSADLAEALNSVVSNNLDIDKINSDINNYYNSISEFIEESQKHKIFKNEIEAYVSKLNYIVHTDYRTKGEAYHELEKVMHVFSDRADPIYIKDINKYINILNINTEGSGIKEITDRLSDILDKMYVNRLSVMERKNYLDVSSDNFLRMASNLSDRLKERDAKLNSILNYSASFISVISVLLALIYWVIINKYVNRFLNNQSKVMSAIKSRNIKDSEENFSNDELGELTHKMWELAAVLYEKDEELRESEEKYRTYINTTPLAVLVSDQDRKILEVNPGAAAMIGYSEQELLSMSYYDLWPEIDEPENTNILQKLAESGKLTFTKEFIKKDKSVVYANVSAIKIMEGKFVAFCQDITDRIRLEQELKDMNENLLEQVRREVDKNLKQDQIIQQQKKLADMGMMVSAIAHQWRQPLNALALCVQDVLEEFDIGDLRREYLDGFEENSMRLIMHMSKTIDDFRDFFLPDKSVTEFSVVQEISDLLRLLGVQIFSRNIDLGLKCICNGDIVECNNLEKEIVCTNSNNLVKGYPGEFKQVIINLIYNSVDSIEENILQGSLVRGIIDISIKCGDTNLIIEICDNGKGIDEDVLPHIFEPYFTTKSEGKGTGIGLYMSKAIIENHMNGKLYASPADIGACIVIDIPLVTK